VGIFSAMIAVTTIHQYHIRIW